MSHTFRERRGAHRPPGLGPAGAIPWFIAAIAVTLIVVYASGWWGHGSGGPSANASSSGPASGASTSKGTTKTTKTTKPATSPSSTTSVTTSSSPTASVDHGQAVTVLNATKQSGLAASAANKLKNAGWTIRNTGNYSAGVDATTVFYGRSSLQLTAQAVADDLGGGAQAQESADFGPSRVTVVLGADYQR